MQFTFHNVSINSDNGEDRMKAVQHLHSIMYLLIREESVFPWMILIHLHSIMYLLILHAGAGGTESCDIYIP